MSSSENSRPWPEVWIFLFASAVLTLWYANPQVFYALSFLYQLVRVLFSGIAPDLTPSGA